MENQTTIRLAYLEDAEEILSIYAGYITDSAFTFETRVPSIDEFKERILEVMDKHCWLVAMTGNSISGFAYHRLHRKRSAYRWTSEVSVYVDKNHQRKNIGKALYLAIFDIAKLQGYHTLLAGITLPNPSSCNFHKQLGFTPFAQYENIGYKMDAWCSTEWWRLDIKNFNNPPIEITDIRSLSQTQDLNELLLIYSNLIKTHAS